MHNPAAHRAIPAACYFDCGCYDACWCQCCCNILELNMITIYISKRLRWHSYYIKEAFSYNDSYCISHKQDAGMTRGAASLNIVLYCYILNAWLLWWFDNYIFSKRLRLPYYGHYINEASLYVKVHLRRGYICY